MSAVNNYLKPLSFHPFLEKSLQEHLAEQIMLNKTNIQIEGDHEFFTFVEGYVKRLCSTDIGCELLQRVILTEKKLPIKLGSQCVFSGEEHVVYMNPKAKSYIVTKKNEQGDIYFAQEDPFFAFPHELIHLLHTEEEGRGPETTSGNSSENLPIIEGCRGFPDTEEFYTVTGVREDGYYNPINERAFSKAYSSLPRETYYGSRFPLGNDTNEVDSDGLTRLMDAAYCGALGNLKDLIAAGANLEVVDITGSTALILAIQRGFYDCAQYLLEKGASADPKPSGYSPLFEAIRMEDIPMVELSLKYKASVDLAPHGETPILIAARKNNLRIVQLLHQHRADIRAADGGENALHRTTDPAIADFLIRAGVDVNAKNKMGCTPLDLATGKNNVNMMNILQKNGATLSGCPPLSNREGRFLVFLNQMETQETEQKDRSLAKQT